MKADFLMIDECLVGDMMKDGKPIPEKMLELFDPDSLVDMIVSCYRCEKEIYGIEGFHLGRDRFICLECNEKLIKKWRCKNEKA